MLSTNLKRGSTGSEVRQVQRLLNLAGARPRLDPDGRFGLDTEKAVRDFQSKHDLRADGLVDSIMWSKLEGATSEADPPGVQPATDGGQPADPSAAGTAQEANAKVRGYPCIKQFMLSKYHSSREGTKITKIVLHCTESGLESAKNSLLGKTKRKVSAHYLVDRNGDIYQLVPDDEVANHCVGANMESIGIEHVGFENDELAPPQATAAAALIGWLMKQHGVELEYVTGHNFTLGYRKDLTGGTSCPDALFGYPKNQDTITAWLKKNVKL